MGWVMLVLMFVATVAFWAVVLMGIRALFLGGGRAGERGPRDANAAPERPPLSD